MPGGEAGHCFDLRTPLPVEVCERRECRNSSSSSAAPYPCFLDAHISFSDARFDVCRDASFCFFSVAVIGVMNAALIVKVVRVRVLHVRDGDAPTRVPRCYIMPCDVSTFVTALMRWMLCVLENSEHAGAFVREPHETLR